MSMKNTNDTRDIPACPASTYFATACPIITVQFLLLSSQSSSAKEAETQLLL
jgi:hypothetical protein